MRPAPAADGPGAAPSGESAGGDVPGGDLPAGDLARGDVPGGDQAGGELPGGRAPGGAGLGSGSAASSVGPQFAVVILAGGRGRRLGGADKPALQVRGRSLLDIALAAAAGGPIVVVGPVRELPTGVRSTREEPAGGGPAAGIDAGFRALPPLGPAAMVGVLAADLPGIGAGTLARLRAALSTADSNGREADPADPAAAGPSDAAADASDGVRPVGAVLLDASGRRQNLIGVWRYPALAFALARRDSWHNISVRDLLSDLPVIEVPGTAGETADIDTPADLRHWREREAPPSY